MYSFEGIGMNPKQIIVVRKDLNMRKGKIASQAAHASMAVILNNGKYYFWCDEDNNEVCNEFILDLKGKDVLSRWLKGSFTKICVYVNSEEELVSVYEQAKAAGLLCSMIEDNGATEFNGVKTKTCCAIGPDFPEKIDPITKHLPLL